MKLKILLGMVAATLLGLMMAMPPQEAEARESLGYPFSDGQTWRVQRGYNCVQSNGTHCSTHGPGGLNQYALDLQRTNCGGCASGGEAIRAVYSGTITWSRNFGTGAGCMVVLQGDDNARFAYIHLAYSSGTNCGTVSEGQSVSKGQTIGTVYSPQNHIHVQWCDGGFAACPNSDVPHAMNEGAFPFPAGGPNTPGCGEYCNATMTSSPPDNDGDGVPNSSDNCPNTPNANQANFDGDSEGDACDGDDDNDGMSDAFEDANFCLNHFGADSGADADGDWLSNAEEATFNYTPCSDTEKGGIAANVDWQDIGVAVVEGEWITIDASGQVQESIGSPQRGPQGFGGPYGYGGCPIASLVGLVSPTPPTPGDTGVPAFCVGGHYGYAAPATGRIYLVMNDPGAFQDNSGSWQIEVSRAAIGPVSANAGWQAMNGQLNEGEWFRVTASGVASQSPGQSVGPEGLSGEPYGFGGCRPLELVGTISANLPDAQNPATEVFCIGRSYSGTSPQQGVLFVTMNDPGAFQDNSGSWRVEGRQQRGVNYDPGQVQGWQDSGATVQSGEWFSISASGAVYANPSLPLTSPDGGTSGQTTGWGGCNQFSLVALIGDALPNGNNASIPDAFCVGSDFVGIAPKTGRIYVAMNDPVSFVDNGGLWRIEFSQGWRTRLRGSGGWLDTGVDMAAGQVLQLAGSSVMRAGSVHPLTGPSGNGGAPFGFGGCGQLQLVATVSTAPPSPASPVTPVTCIGHFGSIAAPASGRLYITTNDPASFSDNSGGWRVAISSSSDGDNDGTLDSADNCSSAWNSGQLNSDRDIIDLPASKAFDDLTRPMSDTQGDACDLDDDNDYTLDWWEAGDPICFGYVSDPKNPDTDGDRVIDGGECSTGTNPADPLSKPTLAQCSTAPDFDGDGLSAALEVCFYGTSNGSVDSDGDGCRDDKEVASVNADRVVSALDLSQVAQHFGPSTGAQYIVQFDFNKDGTISAIDLSQVAQRFGPC